MHSFLLIIAVSTFANFASGLLLKPSFSCPNGVLKRREWRTLSIKERKLYIKTVRKLQHRKKEKEPSVYDELAKMHVDQASKIHIYSVFFPWHRWFVRVFEKELQKHSKTMTVPYWNWPYDSQAPELAPVWGEDAFGDNGDPENNNCIKSSPFAKFRPFYPQDHCLRRKWQVTNDDEDEAKRGPIGAFYSTDLINKMLNNAKTYNSLFKGINVPHGTVHMNIGGDMGTMRSPMDPIFYLHHGMVDKIWADWQKAFPKLAHTYNGKRYDGKRANVKDVLDGSENVQVQHVLDTKKLCYVYEEMKIEDAKLPKLDTQAATQMILAQAQLANGASPARHTKLKKITPIDKNVKVKPAPKNKLVVKAHDRSNLLNIRVPIPLSEEWLRMNQIPVAKVRRQEKAAAEIIKELNNIDGYVSPCALWNRPDVLAGLVAKVSVFVADVNNTRLEVKNDKPTKGKVNKDAPTNPVLLEKASEVLSRVRESLPEKKVQEPVKKVAVELIDVIGLPVASKDAAANPFAPRHDGETGYGIKDKKTLSEKVEKVKEKESVDKKTEKKKEQIDKDLRAETKPLDDEQEKSK